MTGNRTPVPPHRPLWTLEKHGPLTPIDVPGARTYAMRGICAARDRDKTQPADAGRPQVESTPTPHRRLSTLNQESSPNPVTTVQPPGLTRPHSYRDDTEGSHESASHEPSALICGFE